MTCIGLETASVESSGSLLESVSEPSPSGFRPRCVLFLLGYYDVYEIVPSSLLANCVLFLGAGVAEGIVIDVVFLVNARSLLWLDNLAIIVCLSSFLLK